MVLTLGTGIGGGIVIDGKTYTGRCSGGEIGNMYLTPQHSFEELVGSKRLLRITKKIFGTSKYLGELLTAKDQKSRKIVKEIMNYYGQAIGTLTNLFDPEAIILTGGVSCSGSAFLWELKKTRKTLH